MGGGARGSARTPRPAQATTLDGTSRSSRSSRRPRPHRSRSPSLGADVAALAALAGRHCDATYRADAAAAAALAAGGSAAAAHLVRVNLGVRAADPRLARALASEQAAHDVAERMLESIVTMQREPYSALPDAELVRRCREGDAEAWNELVERYSRYVYAICRSRVPPERRGRRGRLPGRVHADLHPARLAPRRLGALRPWIAQLTRRRCLDALASKGREIVGRARGRRVEESADLAEVEEAFAVREALARLSDTCQDILDRFFARDQSYKTIADELDIPSGTIASRIARCLGRLRNGARGKRCSRGRPRV